MRWRGWRRRGLGSRDWGLGVGGGRLYSLLLSKPRGSVEDQAEGGLTARRNGGIGTGVMSVLIVDGLKSSMPVKEGKPVGGLAGM
jgi:hypothetical protein